MSTAMAPVYAMSTPARFRRPARVNVGSTKMDTPSIEFADHSADPIKSKDDICRISQYLISQCRYQDNCLFIMGINFGLRCSDLTLLRYGDILNEDLTYKDPIWIRERKTAKRKTGQKTLSIETENGIETVVQYKLKNPRAIYVNDAVAEAFEMYCGERAINFNDYLFYGYKGKPLTRRAVEYKLKKLINEDLGMDIHASTHILRKTFAYHTIMGASDRTRAIEYLQKALGHSEMKTTLDYAGITSDEIRNNTMNLNLGASRYIDVDAKTLCGFQFGGYECEVLELYDPN